MFTQCKMDDKLGIIAISITSTSMAGKDLQEVEAR